MYVMYVFYMYYFAPEKIAGWEMIRLPFGRKMAYFSEAKCPVSLSLAVGF